MKGRKSCKTAHFQAVDKRAVLVVAVGEQCLVWTARKSCKTLHYGRCGRCGRYFPEFIENIALCFLGVLTDRGPFKAALNAFVA
jgi:hypothetical protein